MFETVPHTKLSYYGKYLEYNILFAIKIKVSNELYLFIFHLFYCYIFIFVAVMP